MVDRVVVGAVVTAVVDRVVVTTAVVDRVVVTTAVVDRVVMAEVVVRLIVVEELETGPDGPSGLTTFCHGKVELIGPHRMSE